MDSSAGTRNLSYNSCCPPTSTFRQQPQSCSQHSTVNKTTTSIKVFLNCFHDHVFRTATALSQVVDAEM